jgi:ABC-type antimicrobial peptide transport system permease subunit
VDAEAAAGATAVAGSATRIVRDIDPGLAVFSLETMRDALDRSLRLRRTYSALLALFGLIALLLAAGGIYGVVSFVVAQRTHEIGIRLALGARRAALLGLVLRQSVGLVSVGLVLGFGASLLTGQVIRTLLAGVTPVDPRTFALVAAILLAGGVLAALLPARRAVRVDPVRTLRQD